MYNRDKEYWEAVTLAAIARGRKTPLEAAAAADELLIARKARWPKSEGDIPARGGPGEEPYGT